MSAALSKREPVMLTAVVGWLLALLGSLVVQQWHLMGADEWSTLTATLVPLISGVVALGAGWLLRRVVTPAREWADEHEPIVSEIEDLTGVDVAAALADAEAIYPIKNGSTS